MHYSPLQRVTGNKKQPATGGGASSISYLSKRASSAALRVSVSDLTKLEVERGGGSKTRCRHRGENSRNKSRRRPAGARGEIGNQIS
jgi:hypothetical protein